ncbi:MAG TPA: hypothetical protein DCS21_08160 [Gammaproteobacteria bacterium]|nr:hypothetical protein [Gammaproteobacteria bacterium]
MKITLLNRHIAQTAWRIAKRFDPRLQAVDPDVQAVFDPAIQSSGSAPVAAPAAPEIVLPSDLLALTCFNAHDGIRRMADNADAYRKQLRRFRDRYANAVDELERLAATEGATSARAYCHALKGLTGNLAATALFAQAAGIDAQLKLGNLPDAAALDELRTRLQDAVQEIDGLAAVPEAKPISMSAPLAPERLRGRLAQLAQALEYDLGAAEPLLTELRAGVRDAALAARTDAFDINQVLIQLNVLQERLKSTV